MPWIESKKIIPPMGKEIWLYNDDDTVTLRQLKDVEVYDGRGGTLKTMPKYWQPHNGDPSAPLPPPQKGIDDIETMQEQHNQVKPVFKSEDCKRCLNFNNPEICKETPGPECFKEKE